MTKQDFIISIMGPTGIGKTDLGIALSQEFNSHLLSVDSVQVYKGLDIGSGKLSKNDLKKYPHKLIDICDPREPYSTALFVKDASLEVTSILKDKKVPILVGGTMLYFNSLLKGISNLPEADQTLRMKLANEAKLHGWPYMHDKLKKVDLRSANKIHKNDSQRIQRALEIYHLTGKSMSTLKSENKEPGYKDHRILQFAIHPEDRESLRDKLESRFLGMLEDGLIEEVRALLNLKGISRDLPSMRSVGYRQIWSLLDGKITKDEMIYRSVVATRQLAKRQMTWLKSWNDLNWVTENTNEALDIMLKRLKDEDLL